MDQHIALHWMTIATDLNLWQCNKQKGFQTVTVTAYMFWWPKWVLQIYEAHRTKWFKKIWQSIRQNGKVDLIAKHVEQWDNILCKLLRTFLCHSSSCPSCFTASSVQQVAHFQIDIGYLLVWQNVSPQKWYIKTTLAVHNLFFFCQTSWLNK